MRVTSVGLWITMLCGAMLWPCERASAQGFGIELHNTVNPASGAMGGASIAKPQDLQSAIGGNPATMAQFYGTQFSTNGAWLEATGNLRHTGTGVLPGLSPFSGKSKAVGSALGGFAVAQDLRAFGKRATIGAGLFATAGAGLSYKHIPESNGTADAFSVLTIASTMGIELTDRINVGGSLGLGTGNLFGPFLGISAQTTDYALRGSLGLTYELNPTTELGVYYQTKQSFNFEDTVRLADGAGGFQPAQDMALDLPQNVGIGIANSGLMNGRLLLAVDVLYKNYEDAKFLGAIYDDQWVLQLGSQFKLTPKTRLRLGYVYADDITVENPSPSAGGVTPPGLGDAINYVQAQFPAYNRHRISAGVGVTDVLPGIDLDLFAGGMLGESKDFGEFTSADLESYWVGLGLTWRFRRGHRCDLPAPDQWCGN